MNLSFHSQHGSLYLGFPILPLHSLLETPNHSLSKHQTSLPLDSLYPVGHISTLNPVVISFRLQPIGWLMLITLKRVSAGMEQG